MGSLVTIFCIISFILIVFLLLFITDVVLDAFFKSDLSDNLEKRFVEYFNSKIKNP